jgi:pSer/pThr/pTyr-binding forkhead associated (FHA) protein
MPQQPNGELVTDDGQSFVLGDIITLMGRRKDNDIRIRSMRASARHCVLAFKDGWWWVRDLESSNGTRVNGRRVVEIMLHPGDKLSVGGQSFTIQYSPPSE